nr:MAG TPA: hypothetical protein [Caudoviricetes sp.]
MLTNFTLNVNEIYISTLYIRTIRTYKNGKNVYIVRFKNFLKKLFG